MKASPRQRVLADCDGGMEARQVAVKYRVSESWIRRLRQRRRESGKVAPRKRASPSPKWLAYSESIEQVIAERPDDAQTTPAVAAGRRAKRGALDGY